MTLEELQLYNGKNGAKALVAVNGKIYDVTESSHWLRGSHEGVHQAGQDLTEELKRAPHVRSLIERFPVIDEVTIREEQGATKGTLIAIGLAVALLAGYFLL